MVVKIVIMGVWEWIIRCLTSGISNPIGFLNCLIERFAVVVDWKINDSKWTICHSQVRVHRAQHLVQQIHSIGHHWYSSSIIKRARNSSVPNHYAQPRRRHTACTSTTNGSTFKTDRVLLLLQHVTMTAICCSWPKIFCTWEKNSIRRTPKSISSMTFANDSKAK